MSAEAERISALEAENARLRDRVWHLEMLVAGSAAASELPTNDDSIGTLRDAEGAARAYLNACSDAGLKVRVRRFGSATRYRVELNVPHGDDSTAWYPAHERDAMWTEAARIARETAESYADELDSESINCAEGARWTRGQIFTCDATMPVSLREKIVRPAGGG